ncbi:glycoside hydrolase family 28 protein [Saccharicrinis sp. FJH54]|uniref:glycoside hydrolase family 28 protein n=1 Tax=Saccharicrinis sp. FJH54 TaxID=3344665 RepID=UPI0035D4C190
MNKQITGILILMIVLVSCQTPQSTVITEQTPWGEQVFEVPSFKNKVYNIQDFGAKSKTKFNNQKAIQEAIDKCAEAGGGKVVIPEGTWSTAYLELKSNVNLHLDKGAVLSFLDSIPLYAVPTFTRWEGLECMNYHPLLYTRNQENVAITGEGILEGNGKAWWDLAKGTQIKSLTKLYDLVEAGVAPEERNCLAFEPTSYLRPAMVQFISCKNILVEGIELHSGPMWTTHFVYCENVVARDLRVITTGTNNDGIVPDATNGMLIDNCYFSTGDDCIVIKSGLNEDGWRVGKASENIVIKNCTTKHGHGGVVIGSEMSGGVRNVYAHDCDFSQTQRGLRIKSMKGRGGVIEDLWFEKIRMDNIEREAIKINMHYGSSSIKPRTDSLPTFRNLHYKDITSKNSQYAIRIQGIDSLFVDEVYFENLTLESKYGIVIENAEHTEFKNLKSTTKDYYPLRLSNVQNLTFDSVEFVSASETMINAEKMVENVRFKGVNDKDFKELYKSVSNPDIVVE